MGRAVEFDEVRRRIMEFGRRATLITVTGSNAPHVVTAIIDVTDDRLVATVGSRTRANLQERPDLSLVWHPSDGGEYQLIIDGVAEQIGEPETDAGEATISISVTTGILHRLAGLRCDGPSCLALGD